MWSDISFWFWFAFSWWLVMLSNFSCICCPSICLLWKKVYSDSLAIKKFYCLFLLELYGFFIYFWSDTWVVNIFSHSIGCLFILLMVSIYCAAFYYFILFFFYFTILYCFCHTSTCIHHGCTRVPNPEPPSQLPPHTIPLGHPSAPAPSFLYPASNLDWRFISYMILYMFQCHSPKSSSLALPQSPKDCSIHLCLFGCAAF